MSKIPNLPWWATSDPAQADSAPDTDYADMGTAFGLDASMPAPEERKPGEPVPINDRLNRRSVI